MGNDVLPYLNDIASSLEKLASDGIATGASSQSASSSQGGSALNESILRALRSAFITTVTTESGDVETNYFALIHDQLEDLKSLHIRDILSHLFIRKNNAGLPNEEIYLATDIGFAGDKWGSFGGANAGGGGGGGIDLERVWQSLTNNTDFPNELIDAHHIPIGTGLSIDPDTGLINAGISGTVQVSQGGTGITSIAAYSLLYGHASDSRRVALLSPNITTTKKFLSMTGSGSAGAAPAWDTLSFTDLPNQFLLGNQVASAAARGMLKGVESFSRQLTGESPAPGASTGTIDTTNFYWDSSNGGAWHFRGNLIVDGFGSFGGTHSGSGSGIDLTRVWQSLTNNTDFPNTTINPAHIPVASASAIGGIKVGNNLNIDGNGVLSATGHAYTKAEILALLGDMFVLNTSDTMSGSLGIGTYLTVGTYGSFGTNLNVGEHFTVGGAANPYFYYDDNVDAIRFTGNLVVDGFGSFGGASAGTTDLALAVWKTLTNNNSLSSYDSNTKIAAAHIPIGSGLTTSNGNIIASLGRGLEISSGAVAITDIVVTTGYSGGLKIAICNNGAVPQPGDTGYDSHTIYFERAS